MFFLLALTLFCHVDAWAGGVNRVGGIGPRDEAMGGSGLATADDTAVFYYNPALLAYTNNFIQLGTDYIRADFDYKDPFGRKHDSETGQFIVPLAGINYRPGQKFALGIGLTTPNTLGADFKRRIGLLFKNFLNRNRFHHCLSLDRQFFPWRCSENWLWAS